MSGESVRKDCRKSAKRPIVRVTFKALRCSFFFCFFFLLPAEMDLRSDRMYILPWINDSGRVTEQMKSVSRADLV